LAWGNVSEMTYFVSSGTLNLQSISQSTVRWKNVAKVVAATLSEVFLGINIVATGSHFLLS